MLLFIDRLGLASAAQILLLGFDRARGLSGSEWLMQWRQLFKVIRFNARHGSCTARKQVVLLVR